MNKTENFYNNILIQMGNYGIFVLVIPILFAFYKWRSLDKRLKLFAYYLIGMLGTSLIQQIFTMLVVKFRDFWKPILKSFKIENTHFLNIIGIWVTFILLGLFFAFLLTKIFNRKIILLTIIILCLFSLINHLFIDGFRTYGVIGALSMNLFTLFFSGSYLWFISYNPPNISYFKNPFIWICTAIFFHTIAMMIFGFYADKIYNDDLILFIKCQIFINCVYTITQFIFAYAFYLSKYVKYLK